MPEQNLETHITTSDPMSNTDAMAPKTNAYHAGAQPKKRITATLLPQPQPETEPKCKRHSYHVTMELLSPMHYHQMNGEQGDTMMAERSKAPSFHKAT